MIGNLKPIKLIQYTQTIDANGDAIEELETVYKMWADITDEGGSKSLESGRTAMSDTKTFKINFRGYLVTGDYKVQYFGQTYALTNIKRIQEKRFNYELTGFNTFETNAGGVPDTPVLFETMTYDDVNGLLIFTDGKFGNAYLKILVQKPDGTEYKNRWNESISIGPGQLTEIPYVRFTPFDEAVVKWYFVDPVNFSIISQINQVTLNITRLCIRDFRLYDYTVLNDPLSIYVFINGVYPYNVNGDKLSIAYSIEEYINIMNADTINAQYFQIINYKTSTGGQFPNTYILTCAPVSPYYQWNPADTPLYLEGEIA